VYFNQSEVVNRERRSDYSFTFSIFRTKSTRSFNTIVKYRTVIYNNDTASKEDFKAFTSKPANFANIQNMTQGSVLVHFDNLTEPAESFHIELIQGSDYQLGSPSIMKVIILDRYQGKIRITLL